MEEEKLREAFGKIREDMNFFHQEMEDLKRTLDKITVTLNELIIPTPNQQNPTTQHKTPTTQQPLRALKPQNQGISTGNQGVPTTQQTTQQTTQHPPISTDKFVLNKEPDRISRLQEASKILESLDELKKEVRFKFKKLTNKEMLVFSTIYQLEDLGVPVDYSVVSEKLQLSESSVRVHIANITKKGIPVDKIKHENNKITVSIPQDLKKIASLSTIVQLREL
jgi:hypothetical protein